MTTSLEHAGPGTARRREIALRVLVVLLLVLLGGALAWDLGAERRAIRSMPSAERRLVYEHAFGELQRLCGSRPRDDALERRCSELTRFVVQFPDCDDACQAIARSHVPSPTR